MTNAIISGRLGIAVVGENAPQYLLRRESHDEPIDISPNDALILLREIPDPEYLSDVQEPAIVEQLELASDSAESFDLVLILLDSNLSTRTRKCAANELEELIFNDRVVDRLQQLFYAKPLPPKTDIEGAINIAEGLPGVGLFLTDLRDDQSAIGLVRVGWNALVRNDPSHKDKEPLFLSYGIFPAFVRAMREGTNLSEIVVRFGMDSALKSAIPSVAHVLDAWRRQLPIQPRKPLNQAVTPNYDSPPQVSAPASTRPIHTRGNDALNAAVAQVGRIVEFVNQGQDVQANQVLDQLLHEQMLHRSGATHAVKSLCNIAAQLRGRGRDDYALRCLLRALTLTATDVIAFFQLGTLLRDFDKFDEAGVAYAKALTLTNPSDVYGAQRILAAKAHIFTSQDKYDEAIAAYLSIPFRDDSPSISTAIADVYGRKGNFRDAMKIYVELIENDRTMHRAFAGKAEIAKHRGNPHRALQIYNHLIRNEDTFELDDRSRVVYQLSRCHLFKMVGQNSRAIPIARQIAAQEPYNLRAHTLLASLLTIDGDYGASLAQFSRLRPPPQTLNDEFHEPIHLSVQRFTRRRRKWNIHLLRGLTYFRMNQVASARDELLEKVNLADVLVEDRPFFQSTTAFLHLAEGDTTSAGKVLESIEPVDRPMSELKQVLEGHLRLLKNRSLESWRPRLNPSIPDLTNAVFNIRIGNVRSVLESEVMFFLRAA